MYLKCQWIASCVPSFLNKKVTSDLAYIATDCHLTKLSQKTQHVLSISKPITERSGSQSKLYSMTVISSKSERQAIRAISLTNNVLDSDYEHQQQTVTSSNRYLSPWTPIALLLIPASSTIDAVLDMLSMPSCIWFRFRLRYAVGADQDFCHIQYLWNVKVLKLDAVEDVHGLWRLNTINHFCFNSTAPISAQSDSLTPVVETGAFFSILLLPNFLEELRPMPYDVKLLRWVDGMSTHFATSKPITTFIYNYVRLHTALNYCAKRQWRTNNLQCQILSY